MSGDWIKMRACLLTDPKVMAIARHLETHTQFSRWFTCDEHDKAVICDTALRYTVTGALHNVWCNANEHCDEGANGDVVKGADLPWVDSVCGIQGFGSAMQSVGWIELVDGGIRFPKFNRHNTSGAERQKKYRERKAAERDADSNGSDITRDVTRPSRVTHREEKSIEDSSLGSGVPEPLSANADASQNGDGKKKKDVPKGLVRLIELWNQIEGVQPCRDPTPKRIASYQQRSKRDVWMNSVKTALQKVAASAFCRGKNDRGWLADIDWFLKPDTVTRICEGKYDNHSMPTRVAEIPTGGRPIFNPETGEIVIAKE